MASNAEIDAPVVFSCKQCRSIIGDSFAWIGANAKMNVVVLSGVLRTDQLYARRGVMVCCFTLIDSGYGYHKH